MLVNEGTIPATSFAVSQSEEITIAVGDHEPNQPHRLETNAKFGNYVAS